MFCTSSQLFDSLRLDNLVSLWISDIVLFSLAQLGGIPRPHEKEGAHDWVGMLFWASWMFTQLSQYLVILLSLAMTFVAYLGVRERLAPCLVRVDGVVLFDEFAQVSLVAQPAVLGKLLLLVTYGVSARGPTAFGASGKHPISPLFVSHCRSICSRSVGWYFPDAH
jgi:hypothetical protein